MKTSRDDGIKQFSIQHPTYFSHVLCGKICKMVLYTELFYAIIPACFHTFAVLLSLHLHTFLMFFNNNMISMIMHIMLTKCYIFILHCVQGNLLITVTVH